MSIVPFKNKNVTLFSLLIRNIVNIYSYFLQQEKHANHLLKKIGYNKKCFKFLFFVMHTAF